VRTTIARVLPYLAPHRRRFIVAQVAMLVGTAAGLVFPWAIRDVLDRLLADAEPRYLPLAVGSLTLVALLREVGNSIRGSALGYIGQRIVRDLRGTM
jgi:ABC-type multidrug transport system fused ATPase/permease subunit